MKKLVNNSQKFYRINNNYNRDFNALKKKSKILTLKNIKICCTMNNRDMFKNDLMETCCTMMVLFGRLFITPHTIK